MPVGTTAVDGEVIGGDKEVWQVLDWLLQVLPLGQRRGGGAQVGDCDWLDTFAEVDKDRLFEFKAKY